MLAVAFCLACPRLVPQPLADNEQFFTPGEVLAVADSIEGIHSADLDGDGDLDLLTAGQKGVRKYENVDGLGTYGPAALLASTSYHTRKVLAADLDGDGD